jgi:pyruvate/2-oxoglutarate dehydrogenase complex dihydrolipoamide acyltransferase (E2) component
VSKIVPITPNRHFIIDLLTRAKRFHCPVSTAWQFDVTVLDHVRRDIRVDGRVLGMTACLIKATSLVLRAHPRFNHHLFAGLLGRYEVAFSSVCCTVIVLRRGPGGERILLPLLIEGSDTLSVVEIQRTLDRHRFGPLEELEQFKAIERLKRLPRLALSWFSFKARSDHRFYRRYFGTYGISEMAVGEFGPRGGQSLANTASAFVIGPMFEQTVERDGDVKRRKLQGLSFIADHYILDGVDMLMGMRTLEGLLRHPDRLGLSEFGQ